MTDQMRADLEELKNAKDGVWVRVNDVDKVLDELFKEENHEPEQSRPSQTVLPQG